MFLQEEVQLFLQEEAQPSQAPPSGGTGTANGRPEQIRYLSLASHGSDMSSSRSRCQRRDSPGQRTPSSPSAWTPSRSRKVAEGSFMRHCSPLPEHPGTVGAAGAVEGVELGHVHIGQFEIEDLRVLGDSLAMGRLGDDREIVL
jgi:hypothetical protein